MPPKGKKATSKTAKRPRDSSDSQSEDDIQHNVPQEPAEKAVIDNNDEDSASSEQEDEQARETVQKMLQELQGDLTKSFIAKRKQFCQDIKTSVDTLNEKFGLIFKMQQRERKLLCNNYSHMFETLFQQWEKDVMTVAQEQDNFVNSSHQHAEILNNAMMGQKATIDEAKAIFDQFLKNIHILEDKHRILDAVEQNRLEKELANLKKKLVTENQQQDLAALESCLHSLFSKDNEEDNL